MTPTRKRFVFFPLFLLLTLSQINNSRRLADDIPECRLHNGPHGLGLRSPASPRDPVHPANLQPDLLGHDRDVSGRLGSQPAATWAAAQDLDFDGRPRISQGAVFRIRIQIQNQERHTPKNHQRHKWSEHHQRTEQLRGRDSERFCSQRSRRDAHDCACPSAGSERFAQARSHLIEFPVSAGSLLAMEFGVGRASVGIPNSILVTRNGMERNTHDIATTVSSSSALHTSSLGQIKLQ